MTGRGVIDSFRGEYGFLSNFHHHPVRYGGAEWMSAEHAYQAAKTADPDERRMIMESDTPGRAKRLGRKCSMRDGWDGMRESVMLAIVRAKFVDPKLAARLSATGDAELIEGNEWGDTYWGVCRGRGENRLGRILMTVRDEMHDAG